MKRKSIIFPCANKAELIDEDVPVLGRGDVLVKLAVSCISSGTERANLCGEKNVTILDFDVPFPRRSGYSSSGVVEAVGKDVKSVRPGDRVALSWSTHSSYVCLSECDVHKICDPNITFEEAALWHISTFPMAAIRKCRLEPGESAIVMGQGVLGMMAVKLLRAAGAVPVIAADPVAEKRAQALEIGADYAFDPFNASFASKVKEVTNGGVNVAIEVTGVGQALNSVLDCTARFGRVALLGCTRNSDFTVDYYKKVHGPGISLIGAHTNARPKTESAFGMWTTHDDIMAVQRLVSYGRLDFGSLVAETHSPTDAESVYKRLAAEKSFPLVQFDWRKL